MRKEFVMRGKTASGETEVLNFSGFKPGMAYRLTEFEIFPSLNIFTNSFTDAATITAGKTAVAPDNPDFNDEGLIGVAFIENEDAEHYPISYKTIINNTFLITQNLLLTVSDIYVSPVNWQCRFEAVKMSGPEEAVTNYKQFAISDE